MTDADGTGETNLTGTKASTEAAPSCSPDGEKISYLRGSDPGGELFTDVYVMNADGTRRTRLADNASSPSFAPEGKTIETMWR